MKRAPRLWTEVVSGAPGFAAVGFAAGVVALPTVMVPGVFAVVVAGAGWSLVHCAVGFVARDTPPAIFADEDEAATTWRKCHPGFAPLGGDFGFAGAAASFGT